MNPPKAEILPLIADMHAYGYSAASIARVIGIYGVRHVQQLLDDMCLTKPPLNTVDDLPAELRDRVLLLRNAHRLPEGST